MYQEPLQLVPSSSHVTWEQAEDKTTVQQQQLFEIRFSYALLNTGHSYSKHLRSEIFPKQNSHSSISSSTFNHCLTYTTNILK